MLQKACRGLVVVAGMLAGSVSALAESPLTGEKMVVALRPDTLVDRDFINYSAAVMEAGLLREALVESTFLWARDKPRHMARYYRQALILRAADEGIDLPRGQAPLTGTIQGQVVYEVRLGLIVIRNPVADATVRIAGTRTATTTDANGDFQFTGLQFGNYTLHADGKFALISRVGSATVTLPTAPPSTDPAQIVIYVR